MFNEEITAIASRKITRCKNRNGARVAQSRKVSERGAGANGIFPSSGVAHS